MIGLLVLSRRPKDARTLPSRPDNDPKSRTGFVVLSVSVSKGKWELVLLGLGPCSPPWLPFGGGLGGLGGSGGVGMSLVFSKSFGKVAAAAPLLW